MKRLIALLFAALLAVCPALAEQVLDDDDDEVLALIGAEGILNQTPDPGAVAQTMPPPVEMKPLPWDASSAACEPHEDGFLPDDAGYHDDSIDVSVETFRAYDTTIMVVNVALTDVSQFRTSLAARYPSTQTVVVSTMAKKARAVLAMNGDYFNFHDEGFVKRNGVVYREKASTRRDTLIVDYNGDFTILPKTTREEWERVRDDTLHSFCFGPGLVVNGVPLLDTSEVKLDLGRNKATQRIAIAQTGRLQYAIIATQGPENKNSRGLTLAEFAQLLYDRGYQNAYNMDGGSSSTVVLHYRKINSRDSKIRPVGDCIWFASLAE